MGSARAHLTVVAPALAAAPVPLYRPSVSPHTDALVRRAVESGWLGYGPACRELEGSFAARGGWALATQSCTAALWTVATITRPRAGAEVVIPATTYAGCASAFTTAGWRPVFADIDPTTGLVDPEDVVRKITPRTAAVLVVDTYGQRGPAATLRALCDAHGLLLVHDAAHRIDLDETATSPADYVCYSFGPTKEASSPEGGLIWSRHADQEARARAATLVGLDTDTWTRSRQSRHESVAATDRIGLKLRQNDICASFILANLPTLGAGRAHRHAMLAALRDELAGTPLHVPERDARDSVLMLHARVAADLRDSLRAFLAARGVSTSDHYPSLARFLGTDDVTPHADRFGREVCILPMYVCMTRDDVMTVGAAVREWSDGPGADARLVAGDPRH